MSYLTLWENGRDLVVAGTPNEARELAREARRCTPAEAEGNGWREYRYAMVTIALDHEEPGKEETLYLTPIQAVRRFGAGYVCSAD